MFLMATLHFPAQSENIQENVAQVKITTEKTGQDVMQIKDDIAKMKGKYTFVFCFLFFLCGDSRTKFSTNMLRHSR